MSNWAFVGISFGLTWVVLAVYLVLIGRRLAAAERQLAQTEAAPPVPESARVGRLLAVEAVR